MQRHLYCIQNNVKIKAAKKGSIMNKIITTLLLVFVLAFAFGTQSAIALEPTNTTVYGTISTINTDGTVSVIASDGTSYTVALPVGTDPATLKVGALVKLTGTLDATGLFTVLTVEFNQNTNGYFCSQSVLAQPAGQKFADQFGADYLSLQWMFCNDKLGWGEIRNMLRFSDKTGVDTATLQAARDQGQGWGQIFKQFLPSTGNQNGNSDHTNNGNGNGNNGNNGNSNKPNKP